MFNFILATLIAGFVVAGAQPPNSWTPCGSPITFEPPGGPTTVFPTECNWFVVQAAGGGGAGYSSGTENLSGGGGGGSGARARLLGYVPVGSVGSIAPITVGGGGVVQPGGFYHVLPPYQNSTGTSTMFTLSGAVTCGVPLSLYFVLGGGLTGLHISGGAGGDVSYTIIGSPSDPVSIAGAAGGIQGTWSGYGQGKWGTVINSNPGCWVIPGAGGAAGHLDVEGEAGWAGWAGRWNVPIGEGAGPGGPNAGGGGGSQEPGWGGSGGTATTAAGAGAPGCGGGGNVGPGGLNAGAGGDGYITVEFFN